MEISRKNYATLFIDFVSFAILNIILISIIGYFTIDSGANFNSRLAGLLLSFFIPIFLVFVSKKMDTVERLLKFGSGYIFYLVFGLVTAGFIQMYISMLIPCLLISLGTLYHGDKILKGFDK